VRTGRSALAIWSLRFLTATWSATALLYASPVRRLPGPMSAFVVTIIVSTIATGLTMLASTVDDAVEAPPARPRPPSAPSPVRRAEAPTATAGWADGRYLMEAANPAEAQCPRCGSFDVAPAAPVDEQTRSCRICGLAWPSNGLQIEPDVVIRSWLHR
jgi:hypothetical protein